MKTIRFFLKLACIAITLTSSIACTEDDSNDDTATTQNEIETLMHSGTWYISSFIDSGENETHHFSNYQFTFGNNGVLTATNGSTTYEGSWSISDDSNSDDDSNDSSDDLDFNIHFNLTNDFEDLNDDWDIVTHTNSHIELIDISGGNGGTDYLNFMKN